MNVEVKIKIEAREVYPVHLRCLQRALFYDAESWQYIVSSGNWVIFFPWDMDEAFTMHSSG